MQTTNWSDGALLPGESSSQGGTHLGIGFCFPKELRKMLFVVGDKYYELDNPPTSAH